MLRSDVCGNYWCNVVSKCYGNDSGREGNDTGEAAAIVAKETMATAAAR
jgi:hypothetical protein